MIKGGELVEAAGRIGSIAAAHAERHDRDGTFVEEAWAALKEAGWFAAPVPVELGGGGATVAEVAAGQRALAHHCSATALASSMPMHVVLAAAWRWRRGDAVVEPMLRKVAGGAVVASTGGGDFFTPQAVATPVEGGFQVNGRKRFVSGAPGSDLASGWAIVEGTEEAIAFGIALTADGVTVEETWDAHGMRGTASHDLVLDGAFVPEGAVNARRPVGRLVPGLVTVVNHALPVIMAAYVGVAEAAVERAAALLASSSRGQDLGAQRQLGLARQHLVVADWVLRGAMASNGDDPDPSADNFAATALAKRELGERVLAAAEAAVAAVGGAAFHRRTGLEQALRDLRGAPFHPVEGDTALVYAGRHAMGIDILA